MHCYSSASLNAHAVILDPNINQSLVEKSKNFVFVSIKLLSKTILIGSLYSLPNHILDQDLPSWLLDYVKDNNVLILENLNAHSTLEGYKRDDAQGELLLDFITSHRLKILNVYLCHLPFQSLDRRQQGRSDPSLCSQSLYTNIRNWEVS